MPFERRTNAFGKALLRFFGVITPFERRYYALFGIITLLKGDITLFHIMMPFERRTK